MRKAAFLLLSEWMNEMHATFCTQTSEIALIYLIIFTLLVFYKVMCFKIFYQSFIILNSMFPLLASQLNHLHLSFISHAAAGNGFYNNTSQNATYVE